MLLLHRKPVSHSARILQYLKKAGHYGAYNYELSKPSIGGLSWHRRIGNLRADGHNIQCVRLSKGVFKYFLGDEEL